MEGSKEQQHRFLVNIELVGDVYDKFVEEGILDDGDIFIDTIEWKAPFLPNVNDTFHWYKFISEEVIKYIEEAEDEIFKKECINNEDSKRVELYNISSESVVIERSWFTEEDYTSCTLVISAKQKDL